MCSIGNGDKFVFAGNGWGKSIKGRKNNKDLPAIGQVHVIMARPERFELPTTWFEARDSIQLSYGRVFADGQ